MERQRRHHLSSVFIRAALVVTCLLLQNLVIPVMAAAHFEDQKNFFPFPGTAPPVSYTPPPAPPTPHHGGGSTPSSHGGNPPSEGHGHHTHTPSPPSSGSGGGGNHHSPPTAAVTPPTTPGTTPSVPVPSPPLPLDPNSIPFTCSYWRNHPTLIWGLLGWWGTMGTAFGVGSLPGYGTHMNLLQALSNTRTDGFGQLYREGTAALLNSMAHAKFPYTSTQVRDSFVGALGSNKAAATQAHLFKLANEGRIRPAF